VYLQATAFQSERQCTLHVAVAAAGPLTSHSPKVVYEIQCDHMNSVAEMAGLFSFGKCFSGKKKVDIDA